MKTQVYPLRLTPEAHKALKVAAAKEGVTMGEWLEKAIWDRIAWDRIAKEKKC